jgi:hypothetical protein
MSFGHFTAEDVASLMNRIRNWAALTASFVFLLEIKPRSAMP